MKVVLREDVETLGRKGDLVDVADGYGRNFLMPRGLAIRATKGVVKQADAMRRNRAARDERERGAAEELASRIGASPVRITVRAGEAGKLFGSVTSADLVEALRAQSEIVLERRWLELDEPLKELGTAQVPVRLHAEVTATLVVEVVAEP